MSFLRLFAQDTLRFSLKISKLVNRLRRASFEPDDLAFADLIGRWPSTEPVMEFRESYR